MEAHALRSGLPSPPRLGRLRRMASDERLVEGVRAGSAEAFEVLFDRYHRPILSFCRHMLGSREEAEDAVQHTFTAAYTSLNGSDKAIQLRPWLYTIARNHCLSQLRARREQSTLEDVEPSVEGLAAQVQRRSDLRDLLHDLAALPFDQRAALVLSELGALSHEEIADVVGCPKGKVKALVFQARSSLAASREARDTPCTEIREQLATLSGGALRRSTLRRHLRECAGCREFQAEVKRQRAAMAVVLPVVPTAALKPALMSAVSAKAGTAVGAGLAAAGAGGGASAGGGAVSGLAAAAANLGAVKLVAVAAIAATAGVGGTVAAVETIDGKPASSPPASTPAGSSGGSTPSGVDPVRATGEHAPGKQTGGVANGKNPKGEHGRSETAPGKAGTSPGRAGTSPGKAKTSPGRVGSSPGRSGSARGKARSRPVRTRRRGRSQTRSRTRPQRPARTSPGRSGSSSGGGSGGSGSSGQGGAGGSGQTGRDSGTTSAGGNSGALPSVETESGTAGSRATK